MHPGRRGADARVRRGRLPRASTTGRCTTPKDAFEGLERHGARRRRRGAGPPPAREEDQPRGRNRRRRAERSLGVFRAAEAAAPSPARTADPRRQPSPRCRAPRRAELPRDIDYPEPPVPRARASIEEITCRACSPTSTRRTLFQFQWGYRRKGTPRARVQAASSTSRCARSSTSSARQCAKEKILVPKAAYGYWRCVPEGDTLVLLDPDDEAREVARFTFPRQRGKKHLLHHRLLPRTTASPTSSRCRWSPSASARRDVAREWFAADTLPGLPAPARPLGRDGRGAGRVRPQARSAASSASRPTTRARCASSSSRATAARATRSATPPAPTWRTRRSCSTSRARERIGITLSDEIQLWPEQSTSALVCHHPSAKYFTI